VSLPYQIAVLCYLFDAEGRLLLLHRRKPPNLDLYSPIGGKLEQATGESPTQCAVREIHEEVGLRVAADDLHLAGIVSEAGYRGESHWLMFLYEVTHPVHVTPSEFREGRLEWHAREALDHLPIPETDRHIIWPLFWRHRDSRTFFMAHIDCAADGGMTWRVEQGG
jgi:8-oxo-dGTP diphosphatase